MTPHTCLTCVLAALCEINPRPAGPCANWLEHAPEPPRRAGKLVKVPTLNDGLDQSTARELIKRFGEAQTGMRRIVALGLFAWEIKELKLSHGEWGPWLASHCPNLATTSVSGKPTASRALRSYMDLTRGVLETVGYTVEQYLEHISNWQIMPICHGGKYLLLPDRKVPESIRSLKEKICELVDNKTQRQLFLEFKQAEDGKPKVGRLKGEGGRPPAPDGTIEEIVAARVAQSIRIAGKADQALEKLGVDWLGWNDDQCAALLSSLDRTSQCIRTWLATPPATRNMRDIADRWKTL